MNKIVEYAEKRSYTYHIYLSLFSFAAYVSIIIFGFAPISQRIEDGSGYTTMDLQNASNSNEVDDILVAFEPVMDDVKLLTFLDYLFIIAGLVLFISLNSIMIKGFRGRFSFNLSRVPELGIVLTITSRTLDSLENLWTYLIYSNPEDYRTSLIPLMNYTENVKWIVVAIQYSIFVIGVILTFIDKFLRTAKYTIDSTEDQPMK